MESDIHPDTTELNIDPRHTIDKSQQLAWITSSEFNPRGGQEFFINIDFISHGVSHHS